MLLFNNSSSNDPITLLSSITDMLTFFECLLTDILRVLTLVEMCFYQSTFFTPIDVSYSLFYTSLHTPPILKMKWNSSIVPVALLRVMLLKLRCAIWADKLLLYLFLIHNHLRIVAVLRMQSTRNRGWLLFSLVHGNNTEDCRRNPANSHRSLAIWPPFWKIAAWQENSELLSFPHQNSRC